MDIITSNMIERLCSEEPRKMQQLLPELIKRLIICSVNNCLTAIRIPDKEDIWAPGFDGVIECTESSVYVKAGKSVWEFGTSDDSLKKINSDYNKRTADSLGFDIKNTSFYLVTTKIWAFDNQGSSITKWESEHTDWKSVRVYDACILSDWVNSCPEVAVWFLESFNNKINNFSTLQAAWKCLSNNTSPSLVPKIFLNGRNEEKVDFFKLIEDRNIIKIQSKTQIDAYGFCITALMEDKDLLNRVIIIETEDTYKALSHECRGKIFLLKPMELSSFIEGNTTIVCYSKEAISIQADIKLKPMRKNQVTDALREMRIPEAEIENIYNQTHGELLPLIRRIPGNSNMTKPEWSENPNNKLLYPILFLRHFDVNNPTVKKLCEALSDVSFDEIISAYDDYLLLEDSPIKKIEDVYSIVSCEETWSVLAPDIHGVEFRRLINTIILMLDIYSGKAENKLQMGCDSGSFIYTLSLGILLYAYDYNDNHLLSQNVASIVTKLWHNPELYVSLRLFAEACPEQVMDFLEEDYHSDSSKIKRIFSDGGHGSHYTDILYVLDHLASVNETKIKACNLLFLLCSIQTEYSYSTTPMDTLLFALWFYNTESELQLSEKVRLILKYMADDNIGTKLACELLIKDSAYRNVRIGSPKKQANHISLSEFIDAVKIVSKALIEKVLERKEQEIIVKLLNHFWAIPPDILSHLLDGIQTVNFQQIEWIEICYTIRDKAKWYKENEAGNYQDYLIRFEDFIKKIDSREKSNSLLCLFFGDYYDHDTIMSMRTASNDDDYFDMEKAALRRIAPLNELHDMEGTTILSTLLKLMRDSHEWGQVLAQSKYCLTIEEICEIARTEKKYLLLAGFLDRIDPSDAYKMVLSFSEDEQKILIPQIYNKQFADLIEEEWMLALFWSNKSMREYSDEEFMTLLKYNPNGLLPYYVYLNRSSIPENKSTILRILSAIIYMNQETAYAFANGTDVFNCIFSSLDAIGYYSDEYAEICLYLSKYKHGSQLHECAKLFYYKHPEKISNLINKEKDDYFNIIEFTYYYELPKIALENYDSLNSFLHTIIAGTDKNHSSFVNIFIGTIISREMAKNKNNGVNNLCKAVENYYNREFDQGFINGHHSLFRTIGDGTDQKEKYFQLMSEASELEIDFPHTASLLKEIAKDYLMLSKSDYIFSELGDIS